ncbi:MAG TPA: pyrroline-5-carboxylate reductase [Chthoniobacteraceae bacterium]|nr:pyrroline-5-carboxylate reductase [Chthoniobacteraceae bacterium]
MKLGFLGCGKMATALVGGVVKAGLYPPEAIRVSDACRAAMERLCTATGVQPAADNRTLAAEVDALVLCVKPGDAEPALEALRGELKGKLLISIAAGLTLKRLEKAAGDTVRVVRVMPNTPALIGVGASAFSPGRGVTPDDLRRVQEIFDAVGYSVEVKENLLDAVTGLSGSGPAYVFVMIEALADGGVRMGLPRDLALKLAAQTVLGSASLVMEKGEHPAVLKDQVASPGGTTIAGLEALEAGALRATLIHAVRAATERSRELGSAS